MQSLPSSATQPPRTVLSPFSSIQSQKNGIGPQPSGGSDLPSQSPHDVSMIEADRQQLRLSQQSQHASTGDMHPQQSPEMERLEMKREKREIQAQQLYASLHNAALTLSSSLARVVKNASKATVRHEVMQILGAESDEALEDALYSCVFAQLDLANLEFRRKQETDQSNAFPVADRIPAGSGMDAELEVLSARTRISSGLVHVTEDFLSVPPCNNLLATASDEIAVAERDPTVGEEYLGTEHLMESIWF
jgi:hypothetical protein